MLPVITVQDQRLADAGLTGARLHERVEAVVLQTAGDQVVLAIDGVRVVARLTAPEQAAALAERRTAQFIVREVSDHGITLQLVNAAEGESASAPAPSPDIVPGILARIGLDADEANVLVARALVSRGLPVTPDLLAELKAALSGLPRWGRAEAEAAAALKAAGLPLSPGTVELVQGQPPPLIQSLAQLRHGLRSLMQSGPPPRLADCVRTALEVLGDFSVHWAAPRESLAGQLRRLVATLGRSLEHHLAGPDAKESGGSGGLLALTQLRRGLAEGAPKAQAVIADIDRLLDGLRLEQFHDVAPQGQPAHGHWLSLPLALAGAPPGRLTSARLRVARHANGPAAKVDPANTALVVRVDLEDEQALQVELSVVRRQIGARVTATSAELRDRAEAELPGLAAGLRELGFVMPAARCEVGQLPRESGPAATPPASRLREIDMEV